MILATLEDFMASRAEDPPLESDHEAVMRATLALQVASDAVEAYCGRTFDLQTQTVYLNGNGRQDILLPDPPIVELVEVITIDTDGDETTVDLEDIRTDLKAGILHRMDQAWPQGFANIQVEYSCGYLNPNDEPQEDSGPELQVLPKAIQGAVLSLASRLYALNANAGSSGALQSVTMGVYSETYADAGATDTTSGLTELETSTLDRYRLVRVA